ncbi:matrixin family metalloprotease [Aquipuribacter nitratireducens]|uniref:Matrixin family metalloprotease n=1 Tax=Aquipuribacter nitratireducens TaxID=650104 RepID=A0ABW0GHG4_9MICO
MPDDVRAFTHLADVPTTSPGEENEGFAGVQEFLDRFGYLDRTAVHLMENDDPTQEALARFQRFYGLEPTGVFDEATREAMMQPRCALPDPQGDPNSIDFATTCAWADRSLTFAFDTGTDDVAGGGEFDAIRRAIATWRGLGGLTFTEVAVGASPDIRIGWRPANDPDHSMVGGVLAHADFPPGCSVVTNTLPKPVHFDDTEHTWSVGAVSGAFDIETVALHELGHIVGLAHSSVAGAVMAPTVSANFTKRALTQDDVDGFRRLYPAPPSAWSSWSSLGGVITSNITVGINGDGRMEPFVRGTDGAVWHRWQTAPSNGWSGWASRGGVITSDIAAGRNADGRIEIFARGTDNALWHQWQTSGPSWSGWHSLGGVITGPPAVSRNRDGRLEVFARGTDGAVWHRWQTAPNGTWAGWSSLGGVITSDITVGVNGDGRMEFFARGTDGAVWHRWQTAPSNGWSGWASLGGVITSNIACGNNADGRLEIFLRGTDNALWHKWQVPGGWSGWASLGGVITSDPAVGRNRSGRLEVFARGTDNALWHKWQVAPNGTWSGWASRGGVITTEPTVASNADGRLEVFARGTDNAMWHQWQNQPFLTVDEQAEVTSLELGEQMPEQRADTESYEAAAQEQLVGDMPVAGMSPMESTESGATVIELDGMPGSAMPEGPDAEADMPVAAMAEEATTTAQPSHPAPA